MVKILCLILFFILSNFGLTNVYSSELIDKDFKNKFLIFVEKEFLNYKINIKKNDDNLIIYDENEKEYLVELKFINENEQNTIKKEIFLFLY